MLSELLDRVYPPLEGRQPLPALYMPAAYAAMLLGYSRGPGAPQTLAVTAALAALALARPRYAAGDVMGDYSLSGAMFLMLLTYWDLGTAAGADGPRFVGDVDDDSGKNQTAGKGKGKKPRGRGARDNETAWQRLCWALRLASTTRGIGWNWRVKGVPAHYRGARRQSRGRFAAARALDAAWFAAAKALAVYVVGFCQAVKPAVVIAAGYGSPAVREFLVDAVVSWCGAVWSFCTIGLAHTAAAALTVLLGLCDPWEWPPIFDSLGTAWSVRQVWSTTYHQNLRRALQQPGVRLARFLGLRKGTLASRYLQLYVAFFLSFAVHWWQSYVAVRGDRGELAFFMAQPVVITIEDFLRWIWHGAVDAERRRDLARFERRVGYVWTVAAFTLTLRPAIRGWTGTSMIGGASPDEVAAVGLGRRHGELYLSGW
ncbi:membrane bound O-acyl transferase family-domain-containing protein [Hypoxylon sp. FL1284]|nr:membrane bound O-acyl transferase family-domain-containing protein [Hypoxylon sp. FL1284]